MEAKRIYGIQTYHRYQTYHIPTLPINSPHCQSPRLLLPVQVQTMRHPLPFPTQLRAPVPITKARLQASPPAPVQPATSGPLPPLLLHHHLPSPPRLLPGRAPAREGPRGSAMFADGLRIFSKSQKVVDGQTGCWRAEWLERQVGGSGLQTHAVMVWAGDGEGGW